MLFSLFPYDYPLLWSTASLTEGHLNNLETHLKLLYNSPNLIQRIMHIVTGMGIVGLVLKLYKPSESNMLFDGGSLVLYMIAVIIYITNIVKGLRIVDEGTYGGVQKLAEMTIDQLDDIDSSGRHAETGNDVLGREDSLKVLAASNTIAALVLVGVIVLQIGQWYADRADQRERAKVEEDRARRTSNPAEGRATGAASPTAEGETTRRGNRRNR